MAQQRPAGHTAAVFTVANASPAGGGEEYRPVITEALSLETANAGFRLVPPPRWEAARTGLGTGAADLSLGPVAVAVARAVDADVAATGLYRIDDGRAVVEIKFYDVEQGQLIAAIVRSGRAGLAVYNLVSDAMLEAAPVLTEWLETAELDESRPDSRVTMLNLLSPDEGAEVLVAGRQVTTIREGRGVVATVTADPDVEVETRKPGFHARAQRVSVSSSDPAGARLRPMAAETRWAAEALYTSGQLVGVGLGGRYYITPDRLFLSGDTYIYVQTGFSGDSPVFHDDLRFLAGRYLFLGPYSPVRVGFAAGFGGIITVPSNRDAGGGLDLYLSPANLWVEWNRRQWSLFGRLEGKYAVGTDFLARGWLEVGEGGPPVTLGVVYKW